MNKKKLLIHAWLVEKKDNKYYLPFTHWIYLKKIAQYYDEIVLLSACKKLKPTEETNNNDITSLGKISVYELPTKSGSYISSIKYFFSYLKGYQSIQDVTTFYSRYPTPFGWLQKIYGKDKKRIIHYVGDPSDAARNNPNFSLMKKTLLISGFSLENLLYDWACKGAEVYTNGRYLSEKLHEKNIAATPLISSTLTEDDFYYEIKSISPESAKFIYLGYLRTAKGVDTLIKAFALYNKRHPNSSFTIIGSGELECYLKNIVDINNIKNVRFLGQVESRTLINKELRFADIFVFASLSEGSPRAVLEAMANGLAVISTPVGSLPAVFEDKKDIIFSNFNNPDAFTKEMLMLSNNEDCYNNLRKNSYSKAKSFTIDNFISNIFYD